MKRREIDLTELPDHPDFIAWVLKTKAWDSPYSENPAKGRVECRLSYDGTIKTCCLTGHRFIAPVPLAFFHEGDLERPVSPHEALRTGFVMAHQAFFAICGALCNEEDLRHWIPMAHAWAERNDQAWISDYGEFCWNPGEVIDDYFDMRLEAFRDLIEMKCRGEALPDLRIAPKEDPNQLWLDLPGIKPGRSVEEAMQYLRIDTADKQNGSVCKHSHVAEEASDSRTMTE